MAFLDISGFQEMMRREYSAVKALNQFYNTVFGINRGFNRSKHRNMTKVRSLVVSDCAVIFVDNKHLDRDNVRDLQSILRFIQQVNQDLIKETNLPMMTTCSIAYGRFKYRNRFELEGISREFFMGWPYVRAFLDNEYEEPKIRPGQCRLLRRNLEVNIEPITDPPFSLLEGIGDRKYYYFYWMLPNLKHLTQFEREYENASRLKGQHKYTEIIRVLQKYVRTCDSRKRKSTMRA